MAAHNVKCRLCGKKFDTNKEPFIYIEKSRRYQHKQCPQLSKEEVQEITVKDKLALYILETLGPEVYNNPKIWVQLNRYYNDGLTPSGILNTLVYLYETKSNIKKDGNLGLIPYYYKEAQDFFQKLSKAEEKNKEMNINLFYENYEVKIKSPQRKKKEKNLFSFLDEEVNKE